VHLAGLELRNPVPLTYFAKELANPDFAVQLHAPLVLALAALGGWRIARAEPRLGWVLAYLAVAAGGQALGYLDHHLEVDVWHLVPHEFQWHGQLAIAICAAVGSVHLGRSLADRLSWPGDARLGQLLWISGPLVAALAPAVPYVGLADVYLVDVVRVEQSRRPVVDWIRSSTAIDAVFASPPQLGYLTVAGLTGRKCVAVPLGHLNPGVDGARLLAELRVLLDTNDEQEFLTLARRHRVSHLMMVGSSPDFGRLLSRRLQWRCLEPVFGNHPRGPVIFEVRSPERTGG